MLQVTLLLVFVVCGCAAQNVELASIVGSLVGDDGSPIEGGTVVIKRADAVVPPGAKRSTPPSASYTVQTGVSGAFRFENLRSGRYSLCARSARGLWLNSCDWGSGPVLVTASAGAQKPVTVTLRKGAPITIRLDDPSRAISQNQGKTPGEHLLVGVGAADRLFRLSVLVSENANGKTYQSLVPFGLSTKVVLVSSFYQLADEGGSWIQEKSVAIPVAIPVSQTGGRLIRLLVTGVRTR